MNTALVADGSADPAEPVGAPDPVLSGTPDLRLDDRPTESDARLFRELLLTELPRYYDEVDSSFPDSIVSTVRMGTDPNGYFTASKSLYVGRIAGEPIAFSVVTRKRGGSVKIGPTVVVSGLRRTGVGTAFRARMEKDLIADARVRKLYLTVSAANTRSVLFNLRLGYQIEGVLADQYRAGGRELVMGKLVRSQRLERVPQRALSPCGADGVRVVEGPVDTTELARYLLPAMDEGFFGLDLSYVEAITSALRPNRQTYQGKGKRLVVARREGGLSGTAVLVPKRGGALKISPLVADDMGSLEGLVKRCLEIRRTLGRRRVYAVVPESEIAVIESLAGYGFMVEAQLREAYRPGIDAVVLGRVD